MADLGLQWWSSAFADHWYELNGSLLCLLFSHSLTRTCDSLCFPDNPNLLPFEGCSHCCFAHPALTHYPPTVHPRLSPQMRFPVVLPLMACVKMERPSRKTTLRVSLALVSCFEKSLVPDQCSKKSRTWTKHVELTLRFA